MKTFAKRTTAFLMACAMCCSLLMGASAAKTISKATHTTTAYGGGAASVFYVNAKNTKKTQLNYSCDSGAFYGKNGATTWKCGYFEVLVYGKNSKGNWVQISKTNMKSVAKTTLSMKGYTQYKVRVYPWKTTTIGKTLGGKWNHSSARWYDVGWYPTCTFTAKSNVKSLTK